jgi:hypothetical protein
MSLAFYTTKRLKKLFEQEKCILKTSCIRFKSFFNKKNEASKIKYVQFTLHDIIEEDKHIHRSITVEICAESLSNEIIIELNKTLAREFPSLNAFAKLHCEYE